MRWYLTKYGGLLHKPNPTWPESKGGPTAHGLCGAKLDPSRTESHAEKGITHHVCGRCLEKVKEETE